MQRDAGAEELRDRRLELVTTYNLTSDPRKFAIEQIVLTCMGGELGWYVVQFCVRVRSDGC